MKTVEYNGPKDENDQSSYLVVDGEEFHKGVPRDVKDELAAAVGKAAKDLDHEVSITKASGDSSDASGS